MRTKIIIIFILSFFINFHTFAQEEKNDAGKSEEKSKKNQEAVKVDQEIMIEQKAQELLYEKLRRYRPSNVSKLFQEVFAKEKTLILKEKKIETKEKQLTVNEKELEKKILEFQKKQNDFIGCVEKNNREKEDRINHVVKIISNMRPAKASDVLSVQEEDVAVKVVSLLDPVKASKIFNLMNKEISARIQKQYLNMKK